MRRRPDDYLESPWGGLVGIHLNQQDDSNGTRGIANSNADITLINTALAALSPRTLGSAWAGTNAQLTNAVEGFNTTPIGSKPSKDLAKSGGLSFSLNNEGGDSGTELQDKTETESVWDTVTNVTTAVRGEAVWVFDTQVQYSNFVSGRSADGVSTKAKGGLQD